jgi:uncharacterized protein YbjT (DUF2867 family)
MQFQIRLLDCLTFIHSEDVAAVSVAALVSTDYVGHSLPITDPDSLTSGEATWTIAEAIGEPLKYQAISDEEAHECYSKISCYPEETEAHAGVVAGHSRGSSS